MLARNGEEVCKSAGSGLHGPQGDHRRLFPQPPFKLWFPLLQQQVCDETTNALTPQIKICTFD